jgi:hypothetical protein
VKQQVVVCLATAVSAACSTSSGVALSGRGTYLISLSEICCDRNGFGVKSAAVQEASEFCAESGKTLSVVKAKQKGMVLFRSSAQAEVEFRCN